MDNRIYSAGCAAAYTETLNVLTDMLETVGDCDCGDTVKHDAMRDCCIVLVDLLTDKLTDMLASALVAIVSAQDDSSDAS